MVNTPEPATAYARGLRDLAAGRFEAALASFAVALEEARTPAEAAAAHNKAGVASVALGRRDAARASFCDALARDERCAAALVNLGNLLLEDGHPHDAVDYYEAAIRLDESYADAHRNLGIALRRLGRRADAVRALRAAARLAARRSSRS